MEELLAAELLRPLGVTDYRFRHDRSGNTWAMDGMELNAGDLVKVGCLLANRGRWQGKQLISEKWLAVATQASLVSILDRASGYGLGIVVAEPDARLVVPRSTLDALEKADLSSALAARLRGLSDQEFKGSKKLGEALKQSFSPADLEAISSVAAREMIPLYRDLSNRALLAHSGEIGEVVIALPGHGIAVARTIDEKRGRSGDYGFGSIYRRVLDLVPQEAP
jgi:CubicO group peptidase (beta-lactamase class C family)